MLPPRLITAFQNAPAELVGLCHPHSWDELIAAPGQGMRSIRDILVHLIDAETGWIDHVVRGNPRLSLLRRRPSRISIRSLHYGRHGGRRPRGWTLKPARTMRNLLAPTTYCSALANH